MRVIYHPHAEAELIEAAQYYESRVPALGVQFLDEANQAITRIREVPTRWRLIDDNVRMYLMLRFPYTVYYREYPDHLRILAFKHHSRHPDYWRYRISE